MIRDTKARLNAITWNAASRVATISRATDTIEFIYDGLGNRVAKIIRLGTDPNTWHYEYFVRDEKGTILATYKPAPATPGAPASVRLQQTIFGGAARIGVWTATAANWSGTTTTQPAIELYSRVRGDKQYELANYLGNVEATISDRKTPIAENGAITHYEAIAINSSGYYPFGMLTPGRGAPTPEYRFGYSGLERDDELKGAGNSYYTNARLFDPRVGRWLSPDPVQVIDSTPYIGFDNNPARFSDPKGEQKCDATIMSCGRGYYLRPMRPEGPSPGMQRNVTLSQLHSIDQKGLHQFVEPPGVIEQMGIDILRTDAGKSVYAIGVIAETSAEVTTVPAMAAEALPELALAAGIESAAVLSYEEMLIIEGRCRENMTTPAGKRRFGDVVPDGHYPGMWRSVLAGGRLSDMANLTWSKPNKTPRKGRACDITLRV